MTFKIGGCWVMYLNIQCFYCAEKSPYWAVVYSSSVVRAGVLHTEATVLTACGPLLHLSPPLSLPTSSHSPAVLLLQALKIPQKILKEKVPTNNVLQTS